MDGVSVASGIAGLVSLALQVSGLIYQYASAVKDHRKNIEELKSELDLLGDVLSQLRTFLLTNSAETTTFDDDSVLIKAVADCRARIERIGERLKLPGQSRVSRAIEKLKWPFEQKEVVQMMENLRRFTHTFQFAVGIKGCAMLSKSSVDVSKQLKTMIEKIDKLREENEELGLSTEQFAKRSADLQQVIDFLPLLLQQSEDIKEVSHAVRLAEEREQERRKTEILEWLVPIASLHKHVDVQNRRAPGTGRWFLEDEEFLYWAEDDEAEHDLLCIGGPGVGKTVLCSFVIDHLRVKYEKDDVAVVHYYCDYSEQQTQSGWHFARCLLRQLCQCSPLIPALVSEFYSRTKNEIKDALWFQELQTVLQRVISTFRQCFFIIDALDETDFKDQRKSMFEILEVVRASHGKTRFFATTRQHIGNIEEQFQNVVKVPINADETDLRYFLQKKIQDHPNSKEIMDPSLMDDILSKLCFHAQGMFLLPALQIDQILDQGSKGGVKRALKNLSTNLEEVFKSTIQRIQNSPQAYKRELASNTLMWISHAKRPLTMPELQHALAIRFDEASLDEDDVFSLHAILDSCYGLVEMDKESGIVRFVHFSLEEYLRGQDHGFFTDAQTTITRTCLKYVTFDSLKPLAFKNRSDFSQALVKLPFIEYASLYWGFHAKSISVSKYQDLVLPLTEDGSRLLFVARVRDSRSPDFRKWQQRMLAWSVSGGAGISLAASFGLADLTRLLIGQSATPVLQARNMYGSTPLHEAAMHGFEEVADVLIAHGADIFDSNKGKATPFYLAISYGQLSMCQTLLKYGRQQLDVPCKGGYTALHKASDMGSEVMVTFLLQSGGLVGSLDDDRNTPLHLAARKGHTQVVQLLILSGAVISAGNNEGNSALELAATGGYIDVVRYLLTQGASVSHANKLHWASLHHAARNGHTDVVRLLLDSGADVLRADWGWRTPLQLATKAGKIECVKLLLDYHPELISSQLNHRDRKGSTAKTIAFYTAHYDIYKYLRNLENSLPEHASEKIDETLPLVLAIEAGDLAAVQTILETRPDLLLQPDPWNQTPLHTAFLESQREIAEFILSQGISIDLRGYHRWTPLHIAASIGSLSMLSLALSFNANIFATTSTQQTALHKAASSHSIETVYELLRVGCQPAAQNDRGMNALHVAAHQNFTEAIRLLISPEFGANRGLLLVKDKFGSTPRAWAERSGHLTLASYLRGEERLAKTGRHNNTNNNKNSSSIGNGSNSNASKLDSPVSSLSRHSTTSETQLSRVSSDSAALLAPPASLSRSSSSFTTPHNDISRKSTDSLISSLDALDIHHRDGSVGYSSPFGTPGRHARLSNSFTSATTMSRSNSRGFESGVVEGGEVAEMERRYADMIEFESD